MRITEEYRLYEFIEMVHKTSRIFAAMTKNKGFQKEEFLIMMTLHKLCCNSKYSDGISVKDINEKCSFDKSLISRTLNNLEERGFIVRTADKKDRRCINVKLTSAGDKQILNSQQRFKSALEQIFEEMGKAEADRFLDSTEEFYKATLKQSNKKEGN